MNAQTAFLNQTVAKSMLPGSPGGCTHAPPTARPASNESVPFTCRGRSEPQVRPVAVRAGARRARGCRCRSPARDGAPWAGEARRGEAARQSDPGPGTHPPSRPPVSRRRPPPPKTGWLGRWLAGSSARPPGRHCSASSCCFFFPLPFDRAPGISAGGLSRHT